jgi:hypothetical protein
MNCTGHSAYLSLDVVMHVHFSLKNLPLRILRSICYSLLNSDLGTNRIVSYFWSQDRSFYTKGHLDSRVFRAPRQFRAILQAK